MVEPVIVRGTWLWSVAARPVVWIGVPEAVGALGAAHLPKSFACGNMLAWLVETTEE